MQGLQRGADKIPRESGATVHSLLRGRGGSTVASSPRARRLSSKEPGAGDDRARGEAPAGEGEERDVHEGEKLLRSSDAGRC